MNQVGRRTVEPGRSAGGDMRTYYRDDRVHITSSAICIDGQWHRLDQLERIWRTGRLAAGRRVLIGIGVLVGAILVRVVGGFAWWMGGLRHHLQVWMRSGIIMIILVAAAALAIAVIGVVALEAALSAVEDIRGHARRLELWATVDGQPIML